MQSTSLTQTTAKTAPPLGRQPHHPSSSPPSSAASHGRLKYARPQDLPSFPSVGLKPDHTAASTAASLGWAKQKTLEHQKPEATSPSASTAALLARSHKTPTPAKPGPNKAGFKAAVLAAEAAGRNEARKSAPPSMWGNSAANLAFKAQPAKEAKETPAPERQRSLRAAKGAMAETRQRSKSSPQPLKQTYPDQANAASNALSAATLAHRPSVRATSDGAGAVPYTTMDRQMFTSHPPVGPEAQDQKRADVIHASAVAMAKKMYSQQQRMIDATKQAYGDSRVQSPSGSEPMQFTNLQEAAYKLAQERLAKLHDEHQKNRDYQEYYGSSTAPQQRRFTIRGKLRRRASSDSDVFEDRKRSQEIRQQMSLFSNKLSEVDEQKRQRDREALLAAARRNVKTQLQGMDERVYALTGQVTPSLLGEWQLKAHAAAQARSQARKTDTAGKVDIGGGKLMDRKAVDEIAAKRVQPLLDEINEKAEKERARQEALRLEEEARRMEAEKQKARDKEIKEIHHKLKHEQKEQDRARKEALIQTEKARKEDEKAVIAEQKRQSKEEKRQAHEEPADSQKQDFFTSPTRARKSSKGKEPAAALVLFKRPSKLQTKSREASSSAPVEKPPKSPPSDDEGSSPTSRMRNWLKSRFSRPRAKTSGEADGQKRSFIGGQKLMHSDGTGSMTSLDNRSGSMREVAMAGRIRPLQPTPRPPVGFSHDEPGESSREAADRELVADSSVSSLSSDSDQFTEARDRVSPIGSFAPPRAIRDPVKKNSSSPVRDSRFLENLE